jgi:P pilus assembly chaperone PapD
MTRFAKTLLFCLSLSTFCVPEMAQAMAVRPGTIDLSSSSGENSGQIVVTNDSSKSLPVEILVYQIDLSETGEATAVPADKKFSIFPPQAELKPGQTQVFRAQWIGDPGIKNSESYHFFVKQVAVKLPDQGVKVQMIYKFKILVNVLPPNSKPNVNVVKVAVERDGNGVQRPVIVVKNTGNAISKLADATIRLASGSWQKLLTPEQLRMLIGVGLVQPGKARRFVLPIDLPAGASQIAAVVEFKSR